MSRSMNKPQRDMLIKAILKYGLWSYKLGQLAEKGSFKSRNKFWIERDKQIKKIESYLDCEIDMSRGVISYHDEEEGE